MFRCQVSVSKIHQDINIQIIIPSIPDTRHLTPHFFTNLLLPSNRLLHRTAFRHARAEVGILDYFAVLQPE